MDSSAAQDGVASPAEGARLNEIPLRRTESHFKGHGGAPLHCRAWLPPDPVRVLVIVHGFGEHSGRYEHVGNWFAERGTAVHGFDLRGHGHSAGKRGHVEGFADYLNDLEIFLDHVGDQSGSLSTTLLGHSMGGLIATALAVERSPAVQSLITSGAALALSPELSGFKISMARLLNKIAPRLSMDAGLDAGAISSEVEEVKRYVEDPLVHGSSTTSHATALIDQIERVRGRGAEVEVPVFLTHGGLDRLCLPEGSVAFHQSLPGSLPASNAPRAELRMYPQSYHEILNDVERAQVLADMLDWIERCEKDATADGEGAKADG